MSYYPRNDWRYQSNGLNKSSSQLNYFIPRELKVYNSSYLPLIKQHQEAEIFSNQIDKSNKIKDEILSSKNKFLYHRGIDDNSHNKYNDSWNNFFKRKEREKQRKKIYKIIQDQPLNSSEEEENADDIFRNGLNVMPSKIEDKIKLKRYLPAKKDLVKLMTKVNDNVNDRVDKNSYLLSKNIHNLENGYDDLKEMIEHKINRMERKQEEDFHDLRKYFKRRAQRERDKFDKNELLDNGQNDVDNYYKPNMKENIEQLQTYEIAKRIQNIPNLLDNMIENVESIREYRKEEKNDFLYNFNDNIKGYYNNNIYDEIDNEIDENNFGYYNSFDNYNPGNYDKILDPFYFMLKQSPKYYNYLGQNKPKTDFNRNARKNFLSMSKTDIDKLRKNLKPLTYQMPKHKLNDNEDLLTGRDLMEIYKQRNSNKKYNYYNNRYNPKNSNNINIQENQHINKLKESETVKKTNSKKNDTKGKKDASDDVVVIDSDESTKKENNKSQKEVIKTNETQKQSNKEEKKEEEKKEGKKEENKEEEKKEEEKKESDNSDDDDDDEESNNNNNENKDDNNDDDDEVNNDGN